MSKFIYKLQNVLNLKLKMEGQAKEAFSTARMALDEEEEKLQILKDRKRGYEDRARVLLSGTLDMLEIEPNEEYVDANTDTAWQIESSLREFPNIIPKRIWFRYPLHEEEAEDELKDQPVKDGGKGGRPSKIDDDKIEMYFDEYAVDGYVKLEDIAGALEVHKNSVRGYKSKKFEYVSRG